MIISLLNGPLYENFWIPFYQETFVQNLVEIISVVLEKKLKNVRPYIFAIWLLFLLAKRRVPSFKYTLIHLIYKFFVVLEKSMKMWKVNSRTAVRTERQLNNWKIVCNMKCFNKLDPWRSWEETPLHTPNLSYKTTKRCGPSNETTKTKACCESRCDIIKLYQSSGLILTALHR